MLNFLPLNTRERLSRWFNKGLSYLEVMANNWLASPDRLSQPIIWIVAPPRSGTTLLYQYLSSLLEVWYPTNRASYFYGFPALVGFGENRDQKLSFDSDYGQTLELSGPNEFGSFFYRFFSDRQHYIENFSAEDKKRLVGSLSLIQSRFPMPMLFKNVCNSGRIAALAELPAEHLFIYIKRDWLDTTLSSSKPWESSSDWWSYKPQGWEKMSEKSNLEKCVFQAHQTDKDIRAQFELLSEDSKLFVDYDEFCQNPSIAIDQIQNKFREKGLAVNTKPDIECPSSFKIASKRELYPERAQQLREIFENSGL